MQHYVRMRLLLILALVPTFALGLALSSNDFLGKPQIAATQPKEIVWAGRVFKTEAELARWLKARDVNYGAWLRRHPGIVPRRAAAPAPKTGAAPKRQVESASSAGKGSGGKRDVGDLLVYGLAGLAALVGAVGVVRGGGLLGRALDNRRRRRSWSPHEPGERVARPSALSVVTAPGNQPPLALSAGRVARLQTRPSTPSASAAAVLDGIARARPDVPRRRRPIASFPPIASAPDPAAAAPVDEPPARQRPLPPSPALPRPRVPEPAGVVPVEPQQDYEAVAPPAAPAAEPASPVPQDAVPAPAAPAAEPAPVLPQDAPRRSEEASSAVAVPPVEDVESAAPIAARRPQVSEPRAAERAARRPAARTIHVEPAVENGRAAPDVAPGPAADDSDLCEIDVWQGYLKSQFYARVAPPDEAEYAVALSQPFKSKGLMGRDELSQAAHEELVNALLVEGWTPDGRGPYWWSLRFRPPADD